MAQKNYLHIAAIGQLDNTACWAACLKWWWLATKSIYKSQTSLIGKYNYLTDEYGGMSNQAMESLIVANKMTKETFQSSSSFTSAKLREHLDYSPVFVAYTETSSLKKHVNIIYGMDDSCGNPTVSVMEPQAQENPDKLTYKGKHLIKSLSDFNRLGTVIVGSLMWNL